MTKINLSNIAPNTPQDIINNEGIANLTTKHIEQCTNEALNLLKKINPSITYEEANNIVKEQLLIDLTLPTIINSNNVEDIYNYAKDMPLNEQQLDDLVKALIKTKNAKYIYLFAKDVKDAPINELADAIIETKNYFYILKFAEDIPNAPLQKLAEAVIESNIAAYIYELFFIQGVSIENVVAAMIKTKDAKFNYDLYSQLKKLLAQAIALDDSDLVIFTTKNYQEIDLTKEEIIQKINELLNLVENSIMDIKNIRYIYKLAKDNTHNLELVVKLANAMNNIIIAAKDEEFDTDEAHVIIYLINLIEKINPSENINKEEIISNFISTLVSRKEKYIIEDVYEIIENKAKLTKDIISTKDCDFINFFIDKQLITLEQFYEEAIKLNDIELIIDFIRSGCYSSVVDNIIFLIRKGKNAQHIYRLSQMIIEEVEKENHLFNPKHWYIKLVSKKLAIDIIETEDIKYIKLFRDNIPDININLFNRAIEEIEIKNKYSFKHQEAGPREISDKGISRTLSKPNRGCYEIK